MVVPDSVRLKLARAEQHLWELSGDIGAYLDSSVNKVVLNLQPSDQRLVLVEYHVIAEPDRRLGVIIGDCVHNLRSALDQGTDLVEFDFRQSADGHLVVIHDRTVDRTTDSRARLGKKDTEVSSLSLKELAALDAGSWKDARHRGQSIPTLDATLDLIQERALAMIEHKACDADKLIDLLRKKALVEQVIVQSFDWEWLREVHRTEPRITIAALGEGPLDAKKMEDLQGTGACMLHWRYQDLSLEAIDMLKAAGHLLCTYTADADLSLIGAVAAGLDAITTNRPARLRALITSGKARRQR